MAVVDQVADEFLASIRGDHEPVETVSFTYPGGTAGPAMEVIDGDFQIDVSADVRHNGSFRLVSEDVSAVELKDLLRTPGVEVAYERGMRLSTGEPQTLRVLTGEVGTGNLKLSSQGVEPLPVTVFDSFTRLQRPTPSAFAVPPGVKVPDAVRSLILQYHPQLQWADMMTSKYTTPALAYGSNTVLASVLKEMTDAIGAELFCDNYNRLNLASVPLTTGRDVWTFNLDDPSEVLTADLSSTFDQMPNGVIVTGQHSSGGMVSGEAWDKRSTSPTFYQGEYGKFPRFVPTEKALTDEQCTVMARGLLEKLLGGAYEFVLTIIPNPLLVAGTVCRIISDELGINDRFVLRGISGSVGKENIGTPWTIRLRHGVIPDDLEAP